jgi:hypothetical protein
MGYVNKVMKIIEKGTLLLKKTKSFNFSSVFQLEIIIKTLELL